MAFADDVKNYARTDEDVAAYITAAEAYLKNAGIVIAEDNALYALAVKMLVAYWVDHHITASDTNRTVQPYDFSGILLQLELSQGDST